MLTRGFAHGLLFAWLGLLCVVCARPAQAEALTASQAVTYALRNNGDLETFRHEQPIRQAGQVRAGQLPNPVLELEGATGAMTGSSAENSVSLGISQEFSTAGKRARRRALADHDLELYRWQLADRERLLTTEVKIAFYDALLAAQQSGLADQAIAINRQLLNIAGERLAAGDIPELELNLVKVELARSNAVKTERAGAEDERLTRLGALIGLRPTEAPAVAGTLEPRATVAMTLSDLQQRARSSRPDLKALATEKARGEADILLAEAEGIPNLTAGLVLRRDTTSMEVGGIEGKDTAVTVGLRLSMPLPVFDKNRAGIQEAGARRNVADTRFAAAMKNIEREVESAYTTFLNSDKVLALYRTDILPQLEENLKLTEEAYRLGEVGIVVVIQEQKKFFEVKEAHLAALHNRQAALARLEAAVASELTGGEK